MGRYRSRSRSRSRSYSPVKRKRYDDPRDRRRGRRSPSAPCGLLVRNISLRARTQDLWTAFERYGPIKDVYLPKNYYTGEPRGFGFVKFLYPEDAAAAKEHMDRSVIGGREIRILFAEENRKTPQEMGRVTRTSRGSSRRRSLSRSPRRRPRSYTPSPSPSRSPSPARRDSRDRGRVSRMDKYRFPSVSPWKDRSPRRERSYNSHEKSPVRSGSLSRSPPPRGEKPERASHRQSESPRRKSRSPSRSRSRSYSPK